MSDPGYLPFNKVHAPTITVTQGAKALRQAIRKEYKFPENTLQNIKCHCWSQVVKETANSCLAAVKK